MQLSQNQRRIVFSLSFLCITLLTTTRPVVVTAQSGGCGIRTNFKVARDYYVGRSASVLGSGDFNQDGVPDLAVGNTNDVGGARVSILLSNGQGEVAKLIDYPFGGTFRDLLVGDFNNDGKLDLVVAGATISTPGNTYAGIAIALGLGDGLFGDWKNYEAGREAAALASADFNGDGKPDLAVADRFRGDLLIFTGNGDGTFKPPVTNVLSTALQFIPVAVVTADFNQDNKPDIVFANQNERTLFVFINDGSGRFAVPRKISVRDCYSLLVGDFSGDGQLDLAVGASSALLILRGDGAGGFAAPTELSLGSVSINSTVPNALTKGDFNGNGKLDIAFAAGAGITVLLSDGTGSYVQRNYAAGRQSAAIVASDFNRDGRLDLAATNSESSNLTVLLNAGAADFRGMKVAKISGFVQGLNVAELNNDNKPELLANEGGAIYVGTGNGTGEFSDVKRYDATHKIYNNISASVVADFTGDGNADLAVLNSSSTDSTIGAVTLLPDLALSGSGTGAYLNRIKTFNAGLRSADLVTADFNGDKRPDLAIANSGSDDVTILLNDGRGGFVKSATIGVGLDPRSLVAADFNSDGKMDLVTACRNSAGVFLLLGDGQGGFTVNGIGIGANPRLVVAGDFNRDGKTDLAVAHNNSMFVSILLGTGQGSFAAPMPVDVGGRPFALAITDFNGDNNPDFAVTRYIQSGSDTLFEDRVLLFAGDGTGKFTRTSDLTVPGATYLRTADFNNDGLPDLAIVATPAQGGQSVWIAFSACSLPMADTAVTVNAASYAGVAAAPEAIVSAFGTALSNGTFNAPSVPLPTQLGDTQISVKDSRGVERLAPLFFVSPLQINYQIPAGTAVGIAMVTIRTGTTKTSTGTILVLPTAPGLFAANANGEGVAAAKVFRIKYPTNAESYEEVAQLDPVSNKFITRPIEIGPGLFPINDKVYLLLFGTGLRSRFGPEAVRVKIGNTELPVDYAGPQPEYVGLDQVNVLISNLRGLGEVDVTLTVDGKISNIVRVNIQ